MANKSDIAFHYDRSPEFFRKILGPTMAYSCANWGGVENLESAQQAKLAKLAHFAGIDRQTETCVELGCGWGSFLSFAQAQFPGLAIDAVTLSEEQGRFCSAQGYSQSHVFVQDAYDFLGVNQKKYQSGVSIAALEAFCSPKDYRLGKHIDRLSHFFELCRKSIDGRLGLQTILVNRDMSHSTDRLKMIRFLLFISKSVFPNSLIPTRTDLEKSILPHYSIEEYYVSSDDYAWTLQSWLDNLELCRDTVSNTEFEHFKKYLSMCAEQFANGSLAIGQFSLAARGEAK